jgi:L-lactate dehydrogenase complex protein LldF
MTDSPPLQRTSPIYVGMPSFPVAARVALDNTQQRRNLAHATSTIRAKRAAVVAEVANWEDVRLAGASAKDDALGDLAVYLEELETRLTEQGAKVHWARDAAEANRIVVDLVRARGADEVVKVKSMATQEIELNEALEAAGIHAWETDLAELIVQLGHDRPSHILVPAIHRNRSEVREIFRREMGAVGRPAPDDLTDEPARLAEAARLHLREKFLRAKVAVSGANFAVAETGTLVVVESEGNGRMCLTLPETLISVVGIEKVVPRFADLGPLLTLLPRSSTGERMNPYTSMWTGVTPGDGPQDVHVVLVDNGRTHVLADPVGRQALRCIRCSACLNVCPVYERTGGTRLRFGLPGADRGHPQSATAWGRLGGRCLPPLRLLAVWCLLRGVPRAHRHSRGPRRPAHQGRRGQGRLGGGRGHGSDGLALRLGRSTGPGAARGDPRGATQPGSDAPQPPGATVRLDQCARPTRTPTGDLPRLVDAHP